MKCENSVKSVQELYEIYKNTETGVLQLCEKCVRLCENRVRLCKMCKTM